MALEQIKLQSPASKTTKAQYSVSDEDSGIAADNFATLRYRSASDIRRLMRVLIGP